MSQTEPIQFGSHLAFVDESGDHGLARVDSGYPMFVLAFCLMSKDDYVTRICPTIQRFKFRFWGHDEQVLHEHEIRKPNKHYSFLFDPVRRAEFLGELSQLVDEMPFQLVTSVIRKLEFNRHFALPENPYELSLQFGLERIYRELEARGEGDVLTHIIVEKRGEKEDDQLELAFRRICDSANALNKRLPFELVMIPKSANSAGLQLADLVARPVGIKVLRPNQPNRAYEILAKKFRRSPDGEINDWGLKVVP